MDFDAGGQGGARRRADPGRERPGQSRTTRRASPTRKKTIANDVFVIGVAITLTVQSQDKDPITQEFQQESKALLNVSPRNVFNAWQLVQPRSSTTACSRRRRRTALLLPALRMTTMSTHSHSTLVVRRRGHRPHPGDVHGAHRVAARRVAGDGRQDRDDVEPQLQDDVAGAVRGRVGAPQRRQLPDSHLRAAGRRRRRPPGATTTRTVSPVAYNGQAGGADHGDGRNSNYPVDAKKTRVHGQRRTASSRCRAATTTYSATATLLSMRQFPDAYCRRQRHDPDLADHRRRQPRGRRRRGRAGQRDHRDAGGAGVPLRRVRDRRPVLQALYVRRRRHDRQLRLDRRRSATTPPVDNRQDGGDVGTNGNLTRTAGASRSSTANCPRRVRASAPARPTTSPRWTIAGNGSTVTVKGTGANCRRR